MFHPDRMPPYWWLGKALWQGYARLGLLSFVGLWLGLLAAVCFALLDGRESGFLYVAGLVLGLLLLFVIVLSMTVVLFDPPKLLVFPHWRDRPGAVAMWRESIRASRSQQNV
jgi:hypothetical protein